MRKQAIPFLLAGTLALTLITAPAGAASQASSATKKTTAPGHHTSTHHTTPAEKTTGSLLKPESLKLQAPAVFDAKFVTTKGDFVIQVTRAWAPSGADRFYNLVKYHFFDGAAFFRVVPGFVVQFGMSARPEVQRVWEHAMIQDDPVTQNNAVGTVTFATSGPNSRTTQVFINLRDNSGSLDNQGFSPFGKITSGMQVVEALYSGYGDGPPYGSGPEQGRIASEGKAYLEKSFPKLDTIKVAEIVPPAPAVKHAPAATTEKKPPASAGSRH